MLDPTLVFLVVSRIGDYVLKEDSKAVEGRATVALSKSDVEGANEGKGIGIGFDDEVEIFFGLDGAREYVQTG